MSLTILHFAFCIPYRFKLFDTSAALALLAILARLAHSFYFTLSVSFLATV